jgi:excisionase family DNA binding protein
MAASAHSELQKTSDAVVHFERLLNSTEAAALLRIHPKTLQRMARNGEIAGIQIGKLWRFRASVLNSWLSQKTPGQVHLVLQEAALDAGPQLR